ncbi:HGGxSTG domain-containing protein [Photobacterium leiognathi]|uniref:HGGxSTG domain-containing protein n=1 Tax=Photobacterium leiognathi TaxID=553611 RepID=UPI003AF35C50
MKNKFQLDSLPLCGAKTRQGTPCKRRGNKKNGRCKLHGGKSTGAKTEQGKLASRVNALKLFPSWYFGEPLPQSIYDRAYRSFNELMVLLTKQPIDWVEAYAIIKRDRIPLEALKYDLASKSNLDTFIALQALLDFYYQEENAPHLAFSLYVPIQMPNSFQVPLSSPQHEYLSKWLNSYSKKMFL